MSFNPLLTPEQLGKGASTGAVELLQTSSPAPADAVWEALGRPWLDVVEHVRRVCPGTALNEIAIAYFEALKIGMSADVLGHADYVAWRIRRFPPFDRIELWHAIGRIARVI